MLRLTNARPHAQSLQALLKNDNLPLADRPQVEAQIETYERWIAGMDTLPSDGDGRLAQLVESLNAYKKSVEFGLVFCSDYDFLYRQKGQLKLENTILEEFLPRLFDPALVPGFTHYNDLICGPQSCFAGLAFDSPLLPIKDAVLVKLKDQDFSISRNLRVVISRKSDDETPFEQDIGVPYFAAEIKTNLDKTMFQEGAATANELKKVSPGAKYVLLCEWLDMTPINTALTAMDEVIILRKAKRMASNLRKSFATAKGRRSNADRYERFLDDHPLSLSCFERLIRHLNDSFPVSESESAILERGYF